MVKTYQPESDDIGMMECPSWMNGYVRCSDYAALEAKLQAAQEREKAVAISFFHWWWNQLGQNTEQGWGEFVKTQEYQQALQQHDEGGGDGTQ